MNGKFVKSDGQLMVAFPLRKATQTVPAINGIVNYESGHYKWASQFSFCHFYPLFKYPSALHPKERNLKSTDVSTAVRFENLPYYPKDIKDSSKNYLIFTSNF